MSGAPLPGTLVAWWNESELQCGVIAGEDKRRLRLIGQDGRELRVNASRIVLEIEPPGHAPGRTFEERRDAGQRAARMMQRVRELAGACDVALVWEIARETPRVYEVGTLAELAFGEGSGAECAALVHALQDDRLHFVRKGDGWEPRPTEAVERLRLERRRTAERARQKERLFAALRSVAGGADFMPEGDETERRYLLALEELALADLDASDTARELAREALAASGLGFDRDHEGAFRLLRLLGRFDSDDVNVHVLRHGLRAAFPGEVEGHAAGAAAVGFSREGREDLTDLTILTIDSPHTREVDDGLSLEVLDGGACRLGIHIADPAVFIEPDDPVDVEALARGVTHYLPEGRIPMLPPVLSEGAGSLLVGLDRPSLSFFADVDGGGGLAGWRVARSVVRTTARLSYEEADRAIRDGTGPHGVLLRDVSQVAERLERRRIDAGAVRIVAPEVDVHVDEQGRAQLERHPADSPARRAVSEAMVLAGRVAAAFCSEAGVPAIYRRQPPPEDPPQLPADGSWDPVAVYGTRRTMRRGEPGLEPGPHHGLGLDAYAQATSPLRRYQDLATHRQIAAALAGRPPVYDVSSLQRIAATTEQADWEARRIERASNRYWLLRYLEQRGEGRLTAVVLAVEPRVVVLLEETLLEQPAPSLQGVEPGERLELEIERINPRADLLVLRRP